MCMCVVYSVDWWKTREVTRSEKGLQEKTFGQVAIVNSARLDGHVLRKGKNSGVRKTLDFEVEGLGKGGGVGQST